MISRSSAQSNQSRKKKTRSDSISNLSQKSGTFRGRRRSKSGDFDSGSLQWKVPPMTTRHHQSYLHGFDDTHAIKEEIEISPRKTLRRMGNGSVISSNKSPAKKDIRFQKSKSRLPSHLQSELLNFPKPSSQSFAIASSRLTNSQTTLKVQDLKQLQNSLMGYARKFNSKIEHPSPTRNRRHEVRKRSTSSRVTDVSRISKQTKTTKT